MIPHKPTNLASTVMRAAVALLVTALAADAAWRLLEPLLPALLVLLALIVVLRLAVGWIRRDGW